VTISNTEVAIIGGGAAGIAAGRRLADARVDCLIAEARLRLEALCASQVRQVHEQAGQCWSLARG
jgi:uncharacterized protein with NAD-binding domain and iron-sulfur cluster